MGYWNSVDRAAGMGVGFGYVALATLALATLLLGLVAPDARRRTLGGALAFVLGSALLLAAGAVAYLSGSSGGGEGEVEGSAYRWLRYFGLLLAGIGMIQLAALLVFRVALRAVRLEPPPILRDLIVAAAYIVLAVSLLGRVGVNLTGVVATSAVVTAVVGFSLQDTLGNIMGGMALQMERSIAVGDWIRVGTHEGMVREIRWRQTSIETRDWNTVIIPNSHLMKGDVVVLGRRAGRPRQTRVAVSFNVDFRHAPTEVIAAAEEALRSDPPAGMAADPPPSCICTEFRDSYASYALRCWVRDLAAPDVVASEVRARLFAGLQRAGIAPSIPAQAVFLTGDDDRRAARKRERELERRLAALRRVELLAPLTEEERRQVAERLRPAPFARGETMTRQGAAAHWLYILTRGTAEVRVHVPAGSGAGGGRAGAGNGQGGAGNGGSGGGGGAGQGTRPAQAPALAGPAGSAATTLDAAALGQRVARLGPGDVFGEMSLMTGEPRSATVIAETDCHCYRLDRDGFVEIVQRRPEIAQAVSRILATRRAELDAVRDGLTEQARLQRARAGEADLLRRIKAFFTLD